MNFPDANLTNKQINASFSSLLQNYNSGSTAYVVNGLGTVVDIYALTAGSASYATTCSYYVYYNVTQSFAFYSSASWASSSISSSYVDAGGVATGILDNSRLPSAINITSITASVLGDTTGTASWAYNTLVSNTSLYASQSQWSVSASFASSSISASYAPVQPAYSSSVASSKQNTLTNIVYTITASNATTSSYILNAVSASYALSASFSPVQPSYSSSVALTKQNTLTNTLYNITASNATTASYFGAGTDNYIPKWSNNQLTATSSLYDNGFVGINTTSPKAYLNIVGNYTTIASTVNADLGFGEATTSSIWGLRVGAAPYNLLLNAERSLGVMANVMTWDRAAGSVGIGTTSPQALLHVFGNISCSNLLGTASLSLLSSISNTSLYASQSQWSVSASFASSSISSSYAPVQPAYSSSVASIKQNLLTNTTYTITASLATTASYFNQIWLTTGSTYPITSSWATNAVSFSGSITSASYARTASILLGSIVSASYALTSSYVPNYVSKPLAIAYAVAL